MKNLKLLLVGAAITPILVLADTPYLTTNLSAGSTGVDVGSVQVTNDTNGDLTVTYEIDSTMAIDTDLPLDSQIGKWCLTEYHLDVQNELADIPQTRKNKAIPGQFLYQDAFECLSSKTVDVKNDGWAAGDEVVVAAHSVVKQLIGATPELLDIPLPQQVWYYVEGGEETYMTATVSNSIGLDGIYHSWCLDEDADLWTNNLYKGIWAVSSYSPHFLDFPYTPPEPEVDYSTYIADSIKNPKKLPMVNWIINEFHESTVQYSACDIQAAIWLVVDDLAPDAQASCTTDLTVSNALEIAAAAEKNPEFKPECGQEIAIVMIGDPDGDWSERTIQTSIIHVPVPCTYEWSSDTAWGGDYPYTRFNDSDWAIWFPYTVQP